MLNMNTSLLLIVELFGSLFLRWSPIIPRCASPITTITYCWHLGYVFVLSVFPVTLWPFAIPVLSPLIFGYGLQLWYPWWKRKGYFYATKRGMSENSLAYKYHIFLQNSNSSSNLIFVMYNHMDQNEVFVFPHLLMAGNLTQLVFYRPRNCIL